MVWHGDGSVSFRANNGKFLATKRSGHLFATSDSIEDIAKFYFYLINRPILVLKCEQGFVGLRSQSTTKLECNKATYETILVERSAKGVVYFKGKTILWIFSYTYVYENSVYCVSKQCLWAMCPLDAHLHFERRSDFAHFQFDEIAFKE